MLILVSVVISMHNLDDRIYVVRSDMSFLRRHQLGRG